MKKFKGLLVLVILVVLTGCSIGNSPKSKVEALLMKYQTKKIFKKKKKRRKNRRRQSNSNC